MICIYHGPTGLADPTQPIVLPPTGPDAPGRTAGGWKPVWKDAGTVQAQIRAALGPDACEHDPGVCCRKDGVHRRPMRLETPQERHDRRIAQAVNMEPKVARALHPFRPQMDLFADEPLLMLPSGPTVVTSAERYVSETLALSIALGTVDLSWFPEEFSFGNGVTCNSWVPLTNPATGERQTKLLSWCVLSPAWAARHKVDPGVRAALRQAMEGA